MLFGQIYICWSPLCLPFPHLLPAIADPALPSLNCQRKFTTILGARLWPFILPLKALILNTKGPAQVGGYFLCGLLLALRLFFKVNLSAWPKIMKSFQQRISVSKPSLGSPEFYNNQRPHILLSKACQLASALKSLSIVVTVSWATGFSKGKIYISLEDR